MTPPDPQQVAEIAGRLSKAERRASPDPRYHIRRSEPIGRIALRPHRKVRAVARMKPKSWPCAFWFRSALFDRGFTSRRAAFDKLLSHLQGNHHD